MMSNFWHLPINPILKILKNLSNFVILPWNFYNRYYHNLRGSSLILQFIAFYVSEPPKLSQSVLITEFLAGGDLIERTSSAVSSFHYLNK